MSDDDALRALPRDTPDYHARQAAHLRVLAEKTTKHRAKDRLLGEAERHQRLAEEVCFEVLRRRGSAVASMFVSGAWPQVAEVGVGIGISMASLRRF